MDEKQIWCCGASGWTRVIGWFQCIVNGMGTIATFVIILRLFWSTSVDPEDIDTGSPEGNKIVGMITAFVYVYLFVLLFTVASGFVMGVILLKGADQKNPHQLQSWITYAYISLGIYIVVSLLASPAPLGLTILQIIFGGLIQGFCIWVVGTHKKEIMSHEQFDNLN